MLANDGDPGSLSDDLMSWDPDFERVTSDEGRDVRSAWDDVDWADMAAEAELELINSGIVEQSEDRARDYLATYGDAASDRIQWARDEAEALLAELHPSASLAFAAIAAEIAIRFLIVRPLLGGIIFSDVLAERIAARIASGRSAGDRDLLPYVSQHWGLGMEGKRLASGELLLPYLKDTLFAQRDALMHRGEQVNDADAERACEAVRLIVDEVVVSLSHRLRFVWPHSRWSFPNGRERSPFIRPSSA